MKTIVTNVRPKLEARDLIAKLHREGPAMIAAAFEELSDKDQNTLMTGLEAMVNGCYWVGHDVHYGFCDVPQL